MSPTVYTTTLPDGRIAIQVRLQLCKENLNQASGGN